MSRITNFAAYSGLDLYQTRTDTSPDLAKGTQVGQKFYASDGREFVLIQNGAAALVAGHLVAGPPSTAAHQGLAVTAYTAASANGNVPAQVTVTLATTGVCPNEYQGGYAFVATGTGIGQTLKIASHPGVTAGSASCVITLEDNPAVALVAGSSTVSLIRNPYGSANGGTASTFSSSGYVVSTNGVVVNPISAAGEIVGVCFYAIPASTTTAATYGFLQTRGSVCVINDANTVIGLDLMPSSNTAGTLMTYVAANGTRVGYAVQTGTTTQGCWTRIQL